jgi:hypothetical protein
MEMVGAIKSGNGNPGVHREQDIPNGCTPRALRAAV